MAGFYHFVQLPLEQVVSGKRLNQDVMRRAGLADVLRDCLEVPDHVVVTEVGTGPGGTAGCCLYPKALLADDPPGWSYRPEHQEWILVGPTRHLGWERERPPTPLDLARREVLVDYEVSDKHAQKWYVPCARSTDSARSSLPIEYGFGDDGELLRQLAPGYAKLWALSGEVLDVLRGRIDRNELWQVRSALEVLQVNYRIAGAEITALQRMGRALLTKATVRAILLCLVDNDLEQEALEQKKTSTSGSQPDRSAADSSSVSSGTEVDSPATGPPADP